MFGLGNSHSGIEGHNTEREFSHQESESRVHLRVVLEFMRHGKKEKTADGQTDEDVRLIPSARTAAREKGLGLAPQLEVSAVVASPRKRAQESATHVMLSGQPDTTGMSMEEIEAEIAKQLKYGKKIIPDSRLDFFTDKGGLLDKAYAEGWVTKFMVENSDQVAIADDDPQMTSITRVAGNVADLILRYVEMGGNFNRLVGRNPKKYEPLKSQMERYLGTHATINESFLLRLVEKLQGVDRRNEVMAKIGPMFKELQGFRVEIENTGPAQQEIHIKVKLGDEDIDLVVPKVVLEELVADRDEFNKKFQTSDK